MTETTNKQKENRDRIENRGEKFLHFALYFMLFHACTMFTVKCYKLLFFFFFLSLLKSSLLST